MRVGFLNDTTAPDVVENTGVVVGIAVLIIGLVVLCFVTAALVFFIARRQQRLAMRYTKVPQADTPAPPSVKLTDPPPPTVTFHTAMELKPLDAPESRDKYPFIRSQPNPTVKREKKRPPLVRQGKTEAPEKIPSLLLPFEYSLKVPHEPCSCEEANNDDGHNLSLTLMYSAEDCVLTVKIEKAVGLPLREDGTRADLYVRLFFLSQVPLLQQRRTSKTQLARKESAPVFGDVIRYDQMTCDELINSTMQVQVLDYRSYGKHILVAVTSLPLGQVKFENGVASLTLPLALTKSTKNAGLVLFSICYTPETQKLNVILLRAKDLFKGSAKEMEAQAKVTVSVGEKIYGKLKTGKKHSSISPIFNEQLSCTVGYSDIRLVSIIVTIFNGHKSAPNREVGTINVSPSLPGDAFRHWNDVLATPGKAISEWHQLH